MASCNGDENLWVSYVTMRFEKPLMNEAPAHTQLTHNSGRVTQICVFNTVKFGTSASSP